MNVSPVLNNTGLGKLEMVISVNPGRLSEQTLACLYITTTCVAPDCDIYHTTASCLFASMDKENGLQKGEWEERQSKCLKQQSKNNCDWKIEERVIEKGERSTTE